ncbi:hypothetical protein KR018_003506 [Drosophila ironensis]|nr:hypothetical protein KR018_003506 [Drosophila ironensis]
MNQRISHLILLMCILHSVHGLYFYMAPKGYRCFFQGIPDDTSVMVKFKTEKSELSANNFIRPRTGYRIYVEVRDSDDKMLVTRDCGNEGEIRFTALHQGEHEICFHTNSNSTLRLHLDIRVGAKAIDYKEILQKNRMDEMGLRVRQLLDQADQIQKQQNYQRYREQNFRQTNYEIYYHIMFWTWIQISLLVFIWTIQSTQLRRKTYLYRAYRQTFSEDELARFNTREAFNVLIDIIGPKGKNVNSDVITQWIAKIPNPDAHPDEPTMLPLAETLLLKVQQFSETFLREPQAAPESYPKEKYYSIDKNLAEWDRSCQLISDTFLFVCDCKNCKPKESNISANGEYKPA